MTISVHREYQLINGTYKNGTVTIEEDIFITRGEETLNTASSTQKGLNRRDTI